MKAGSASASESIRVLVLESRDKIVLGSPSGLMNGGHGKTKKLTVTPDEAASGPVRVQATDGIVRVNGKPYRGVIEIRRSGKGSLLAVNELDLEEYLRGVISGEMPPDWESEALKAQAVVARTFALYQKRESGRRPYHLVATVNGQVYAGARDERPETDRAVRETAGVVLTYGGRIVPAFFHSSCGGRTEDASELWGLDEPYLKGVDCDCQRISKYGEWEKRIDREVVERSLHARGYRIGTITLAKTGSITRAGRVREVELFNGTTGTFIPAEELRQAVGYDQVPSLFFEVELDGRELVFSGRGRGHGVGLCQWGSRWMAQQGKGYREILRYYFPGTDLVRIHTRTAVDADDRR